MPILICLCYLKVSFLKDRVMAEQVAKDSVEAMLQGDVDNIRAELGMKAVYNLKEINLVVYVKYLLILILLTMNLVDSRQILADHLLT